VFSIIDGVARVVSLEHTFIGELLVIALIKAMALNLEESITALTILGNDRNVLQGDLAERTFAELLIEVGFYLIGRVIDPAANFLDE
jgi:F0F1-type ATP synthase alpha subunit